MSHPPHVESGGGELITERFDFDGGRAVTCFVPPEAPEAAVFSGDGALLAPWGRDLVGAPHIPSTLVVGVHRAPDETMRLHEYSPGFAPQRFEAHARFFLDVRRWALARFGLTPSMERTAVFGVSASAELALALGLRHPDLFGSVWCASPGAGYQPPADLTTTLPRAYLVAGTEEPFFAANTRRWSEALARAGTEVVERERAGVHGGGFWRRELPRMAAWSFGD